MKTFLIMIVVIFCFFIIIKPVKASNFEQEICIIIEQETEIEDYQNITEAFDECVGKQLIELKD